MRILQITAGAANMYCGSCLHDNSLAGELIRQGHQVTLVPLYTPTRTDENNVSHSRVFFGGISIYLQQSSPLFRKTPRFLDRLWDSNLAIRAATSRSIQTSPRRLGELTVATLRGEHGVLKKEFEKLLDWLAAEPAPDVIVLPYTLLIALAEPLKRAFNRPVCCALQGEDLFLEGLAEPWRTESLDLIRSQTRHVDRFLPTSRFYARLMSTYLDIDKSKMEVMPLGVNVKDLAQRTTIPGSATPLTIGYFARVAPEKGLHVLAEAVRLVRRHHPDVRMVAAGYLGPEYKRYLSETQKITPFEYRGELTREGKADFLRSIDVNCVPSPYADPKGLYVLESMAVGTPVISPNHGAFPELLAATGGGILFGKPEPSDVAQTLASLIERPSQLAELGMHGAAGVRNSCTIQHAATRAVQIYTNLSDETTLRATTSQNQ